LGELGENATLRELQEIESLIPAIRNNETSWVSGPC
jgi:hypothetical protein